MNRNIFMINLRIDKMGMLNKINSIILLMVLCFHTYAQNDFCSTKNTSFKEGERLTFHVYYNMGFIWINAGNANFNITTEDMNGHKVYHIIGDGKTANSYEWFYKVKDKYETYIDKETMAPVRFIRNVHEGSTKIYQDITFNHEALQANSNNKVYTVTRCTQDVLSAIYFARNIDYNKYRPGDKIPFTMFLDDKLYSLYIKYEGKEQIKTKMGIFNSIKIVPLLIEGTIFDGGEKMTVWVSDDQNRVPLRVESPILVGSIKVDLMEFEGLRNPFSSMISRD